MVLVQPYKQQFDRNDVWIHISGVYADIDLTHKWCVSGH